jgi:hypothetical protein
MCRENAFETGDLPPSWIANKEPVSKNGINRGLTLLLDAHTDKVRSDAIQQDLKLTSPLQIQPSSVDQDFQGFFAIINSKVSLLSI